MIIRSEKYQNPSEDVYVHPNFPLVEERNPKKYEEIMYLDHLEGVGGHLDIVRKKPIMTCGNEQVCLVLKELMTRYVPTCKERKRFEGSSKIMWLCNILGS